MDEDFMMDTSSDDELDFTTPLWKRISKDALHSASVTSGSVNDRSPLSFRKPFRQKMHDASFSSSATVEAMELGERGSPLSEVTGNVSRSSFLGGKLEMEKGHRSSKSFNFKSKAGVTTEAKAKPSMDKERSLEGIGHSASRQGMRSDVESAAAQHVSGTKSDLDYKSNMGSLAGRSSTFAIERPKMFGKDEYDSQRNLSDLPGSPVKGGWRKLSPAQSPKKVIISPATWRMHKEQDSSSSNSPGSSIHIHWDKSKQMKSTSLESTPRTSSSLSKNRISLSPSPRHSSPSVFGMESPILIPDTPDVSNGHRGNSNNRFKDRKQFSVRNHGRNNHLLNNLLSDESINVSESTSSSNHNGLYTSLSSSSNLANTSAESSFHSPSKRFTDHGVKNLKGSSEKKRRDPVWDFVEDKVSSPEKSPKGFARSLDHRRRMNGVHSRDHSLVHKAASPIKDFGRIRQQCTSTTSEDDELPLISLVNRKHKNDSPPSVGSTNARTGAALTVTSPSKTLSPIRRPWETAPHPIKPSKFVISPWRRHNSGSGGMSSRLDAEDRDASWNKESPSKTALKDISKDLEDKFARRKDRILKAKKDKMKKSLLAIFSSDDEDEGQSDKKRKKGDTDVGPEARAEEVKRRKTNGPVDDRPGPSWRHNGSFSPKDTCTSPTQSVDRKSAEMIDHKKQGSNASSTVSSHSDGLKNRIHSSSIFSTSIATSSPSYPNRGSIPRTVTSSEATANLTFKPTSRDASSINSKKSKGKGKKRGRNATSHSTSPAGRKSSGESQSPAASGLPSSSGTLGNQVNTVQDDSDDEVVIVDPYTYASSLVGSYEKKRTSHKKKEVKPKARASSRGSSGSGAIGGLADESNTVSPAILERFNQMDADEAMARRLQEEFDAEMARSVQQQRPPAHTTTEEANQQDGSMASSSSHAHGSDQPDMRTFGNFNPHHAISIEVSSDVPVQVGNFDWNYDFDPPPLPSLPDSPDRGRPLTPPSPPRRGRRGGGRRRRVDDQGNFDMPDLAIPAYRVNAAEWFNDPVRLLGLPHFNLPDLRMNPQHGRQQGRGRGRGRGRRRGGGAAHNDGNDYDALLQLADRLGPAVDKRLTQSHIDRLPTFKFCKEKHAGSEEENACAICMDEYEEGVELRRLPCFHGYHTSCIDMWLKKNQNPMCPICREEVRIE